MKRILRILTVHTVKDLFRYRSFFLLIFVLFLLDRILHFGDNAPTLHAPESALDAARDVAVFLFETLPPVAVQNLFKLRTAAFLGGLFILKQLISIWPSSDMRRMHRNERSGFGLFRALGVLRWEQILWDAAAVGTLCGIVGAWIFAWYLTFWAAWHVSPTVTWLWAFLLLCFLATPVALAGFSYSSKLAVLSRGRFGEKLHLFFRLFLDRQVFFPSWVFYLMRQTVELLFVLALPTVIMLSALPGWVRVPVAGLVATPVYSFLKMASFKFFLVVYGRFDLVRQEYPDYYRSMENGPKT